MSLDAGAIAETIAKDNGKTRTDALSAEVIPAYVLTDVELASPDQEDLPC